MACASVLSSGSSQIANSAGSSVEELQALMKQRKLKRMLSNRESARRSRQRKQKHMDDLMAQVSQLRKENGHILMALNLTTQHCVGVEAENALLRTQVMELSARLESLNEIVQYYYLDGSSSSSAAGSACDQGLQTSESFFASPWSLMAVNQLPIVASADMFLQDCTQAIM